MSEERIEKWRRAAERWLDLQQAADMLRETKNDVFAQIVSEMDGSTNAERERQARISKRWQEHRDEMLKAEDLARRARLHVRYEQMKFDAWRTEAANARTERHHG